MKLLLALVLTTWCTALLAAWSYKTEKEPMGGETKSATVQASNTIEFDFPYRGPQKPVLHLRIHPRHGRDVILSVARGQFLCRRDNCSVLVRFDEKPATKFAATEPADNSSTVIFIRDYARFVRELRTAKVVRIEASFFLSAGREGDGV